jgi:transcription factor MBP1
LSYTIVDRYLTAISPSSIQVPVFEYKVDAESVMRRRSDNWINATHILKLAGFDKPARTRILEREVQKGVHEKVQGGYGKYQGNLTDAVACHNCLQLTSP